MTDTENSLSFSGLPNRRHELYDALAVPLFLLDTSGHFIEGNQATEQFFSMSFKRLRGKKLHQLTGEHSAIISLFNQVIARKSPVTVHKLIMEIGYPPTRATADVMASPLTDRGHIVMLFWPETPTRRIERQESLKSSALSMRGLSAMLAHEIKNPLTGISGAAQLIEQRLNEADQGLARLIRDEVDRIGRLVDQFSMFSDEGVLPREAVNIHSIFEQVEVLIGVGARAKIRFITDYDPSLPYVWGHRDQLVQMVLNLVKNAAEAINDIDDPVIILRTAFRSDLLVAGGYNKTEAHLPIQCFIEDNGPGIPAAIHPHMFEPFVSSKHSGKGIGLAFVAKVVHDHGGLIEIDSSPKGTRIKLSLPSAKEPCVEPAQERPE